MIKKYLLLICVSLFPVAQVLPQSPAQPVKHPPEIIEAYRVANEFQRLLAENLDFDRAFEATFTKDPLIRRLIAVAESDLRTFDVEEVDDATLISIYKMRFQVMLLLAPLLIAAEKDDRQAVLFPPPIEEIYKRDLPKDVNGLRAFLSELKQDLTVLRAHVDKLTATHPGVREIIRGFKKYLLTPVVPPDHPVKPLTSSSRVLFPGMEYYKIVDHEVIREAGRMRMVSFRLYSIRW